MVIPEGHNLTQCHELDLLGGGSHGAESQVPGADNPVMKTGFASRITLDLMSTPINTVPNSLRNEPEHKV
nr:hypothetical protein BaRGS_028025 [Batillaria attramentaria]